MIHLLLGSALLLASIQVEVETLDGRKTVGALAEWTSKTVVVETDTGSRTFPLRELLALRPQMPPAATGEGANIQVELADGSLLRARRFTVQTGLATIVLVGGTPIRIPTASIAVVHLKEPTDAIEQQWEEIRRMNVAGDVLVVRKGQSVDYLDGVLGDITDEVIHFRLDNQIVPIRRRKVDGLLYYRQADPEYVESMCRMIGHDGTELAMRTVALVNGRFQLESLAGFQWTPPAGMIDWFDFSAGKIQYLGDLVPESAEWTPYFGLPPGARSVLQFGLPRRNKALEGGVLRLGGKQYEKGMALRSRSEVTYRLPGRFRVLSAVAGIDDRMEGRGHVHLVIRGDGRTLYDQTLSGTDEPRALKIDIRGIKKITILVDYGADADVADHLDLCDARVSQ